MPRLTNEALIPEGETPKQRWHYVVEQTRDADADHLAERLNARAAQGYRLRFAVYDNDASADVLSLIFERRLKRSRRVQACRPLRTGGLPPPNLEAACADPACGYVLRDVSNIEYVKRTSNCPNCGAAWPLRTTP